MSAIARSDTSVLGRWWWTVDRWTLAALAMIIGIGAILILAASPAVAQRIGLDGFYFVRRQMLLLLPAVTLMVLISLASPMAVRRIAVVGLAIGIALVALTLINGVEIKGARRWINLPGLSLQPSEFVKPCFAVVSAWMFAEQRRGTGVPGNLIASVLYALVVGLLILQPDLGMAVVISAIWFGQFFLAGLSMIYVAALGGAGALGLGGAYLLLPHVASRIDRFLDPASGDSYQVERSLEAFARGGLWGRGPGEGRVKDVIPDVHADFIFAVAGEEFGVLVCLLIVGLFAFVVLRGFSRLFQETDLFVLLAATGLLTQFGLQAIINMASSLHLMPTKGMTLPFVSYGGSSLVALALGTGMLLALTRRRTGGSGQR
ncbi:MAG: cell division protein FtsW [Proteobacteria bacterium]|nr:cell division protein FtsW [Pseudomonadota bacterium]MBI3496581.1 cell division protein FtsW [Pseudomonadota bacterium]